MAEAPIALAMPAMALPPAPADDQAMDNNEEVVGQDDAIAQPAEVVPQGGDIEMVGQETEAE